MLSKQYLNIVLRYQIHVRWVYPSAHSPHIAHTGNGRIVHAPPFPGRSRFEKKKKLSFNPFDILTNLVKSENPPVKSTRYLEPYESGEVSRGEIGKFVHVQYYVIILLFVLFDVDLALLFPWAFDFKSLGLLPFINTLIFLAMPLFVVYYAFKEGHMRWMK
jgi:NADH dehydrogenase subunit A (EC 1.6.5.3)